ncbi:MAG: ABC transporter permease [Saprospiraceae bacterium]|nr:ABC transporter permease [Saprospiraceae bacterium]
MLFSLAWKNIWRNKTRSLLILGSVVLAIWIATFMMAYALGVIDQRLEDAVDDEISHFQMHHPAFRKDKEARYYIQHGSSILNDLQKDRRIMAVTSRVISLGIAASSLTSTGVKINGVDMEGEKSVTGLDDKLIEGNYFTLSDRNRAIIGQKLAGKLGVGIRSKIVLTFQDSKGNIASGAFRIIGLFKTINSNYDGLNVFVRDEDLARLLEMPSQIHEIAALVHHPDSLDIFMESYREFYPGVSIQDWSDLSPELGIMVESFDQYMVVFLIIILLAVSFGIINTMLMAVLERVRELGMLMAIGMNKLSVFLMIALETIYLVLLGSPLGLLLAYLTIVYTGETGIDLSGLYEDSYASFGIKSIIHPKLNPAQYWRILFLVVITAVLASIYPALTAIRLKPVSAMRKI